MGLATSTLAFVALLTALALPALLWAQGQGVTTEPGIARCHRGARIYALGYLLLGLRGLVPDFISIVIANPTLILGLGTILHGLRQYLGLLPWRRWDLAIAALTAIGIAWLTYIAPNLDGRIALNSFAALPLILAMGWAVWRAPVDRRELPPTLRASFAGSTVLFGLLLLLRGIEAPLGTFAVLPPTLHTAMFEGGFVLAILFHMLLAAFLPMLVSLRAQSAILASRDRLELAQQIGKFLVFELDIPSGKASANAAGWRALGLRPEDTLTIAVFLERIHPEDRATMSQRIATLTRGESNLPAVEYRLINRQTGEETWVAGNSRTELDDTGQPLRVLSILSDVTVQKRALIATKRAAEAARQASEAKSLFIANISHELRTPLNGVIGMAQLLQRTSLDAEQQEFTRSLLASAKTLQGVFENMLDLSRADAGKLRLQPEVIEPREFFHVLAVSHRAAARNKGLEFTLEIAPEIPARWITDPLRLRQILDNLLTNAIKFTEQGGIALSLARCPDDAAGLEIRVRDSGIGMDATTLADLFQPFHQGDASTTRRFGGSGLGLAIAHRLVALLGGRITVASVPGQGTEFRLALPALRIAADASASGGAVTTAPASDDADLTSAVTASAHELPFNAELLVAQAAGDPAFAVEIAQAAGEDLVEQWRMLAAAATASDWATAQRCCHTIKSLALQVAALDLAERFKTLEFQFRDSAGVSETALPSGIEQDLTALAMALRSWTSPH